MEKPKEVGIIFLAHLTKLKIHKNWPRFLQFCLYKYSILQNVVIKVTLMCIKGIM